MHVASKTERRLESSVVVGHFSKKAIVAIDYEAWQKAEAR